MSEMNQVAKDALAAQKRHSVKETRKSLELALRRLVNGNPRVVQKDTKISAASVAKEAGVDRTTLYRFHEPILVEIRRINESTPNELLKDNRSRLAQSIAKQKEYRKLAEEAQASEAALARNYYQLSVRIVELEALLRHRDEVIARLKASLK